MSGRAALRIRRCLRTTQGMLGDAERSINHHPTSYMCIFTCNMCYTNANNMCMYIYIIIYIYILIIHVIYICIFKDCIHRPLRQAWAWRSLSYNPQKMLDFERINCGHSSSHHGKGPRWTFLHVSARIYLQNAQVY